MGFGEGEEGFDLGEGELNGGRDGVNGVGLKEVEWGVSGKEWVGWGFGGCFGEEDGDFGVGVLGMDVGIIGVEFGGVGEGVLVVEGVDDEGRVEVWGLGGVCGFADV